jgi:hypothetical protein
MACTYTINANLAENRLYVKMIGGISLKETDEYTDKLWLSYIDLKKASQSCSI